MGFPDISLSFLFFLNESGNQALFISAGTNINKRDRFVLKPHGKENLEMLFYRFAVTILFFLSCPSPRCLTVRHLIEGLAVSYQ